MPVSNVPSLLPAPPPSTSRAGLDAWIQLRDENVDLKRRLNEQTDTTKKMSAKLQHASEEMHRQQQRQLSTVGQKPPPIKRSSSLEGLVDDLRMQVRDLSKSNSTLKNKLQYYKSMTTAISKRKGMWDHVGSRVDMGTKRAVIVGGSGTSPQRRSPTGEHDDPNAHIPPSTEETEQLHTVINMLRDQLMEKEYMIEQLQFEGLPPPPPEPILPGAPSKEVVDAGVMTDKRGSSPVPVPPPGMTESDKRALESQISALEASLTSVTAQLSSTLVKNGQYETQVASVCEARDQLSQAVEQLTASLKQEREQRSALQEQISRSSAETGRIQELAKVVEQLRSANELLEAENRRLVDLTLEKMSDLDGPCAKHEDIFRQAESTIQRLQEEARASVMSHDVLSNRLQVLTEENKAVHAQAADAQQQVKELKALSEQQQEKLSMFAHANGISVLDIQEALAIIKWRKHKNIPLDVIMASDDILKESSSVVSLRADYLTSLQDLDKTKKLLSVQEAINVDYKRDLTALRTKWTGLKSEYETRQSELARLLDIRQTRILRLERQLRTSYYGKKTLQGDDTEADADAVDNDTPALVVSLYQLTLKRPSSLNAVYFVSSDFYTFDTVVSPLAAGPSAHFGFTVCFPLVADHATLSYLHRNTLSVDVWELVGGNVELVGRCVIPLLGLLELSASMDKLRCTAEVYTANDELSIGQIEYALRFSAVLDEAVRVYREQYELSSPPEIITSHHHHHHQQRSDRRPKGTKDAAQAELCIRIHHCSDIVSQSEQSVPAVYVTCQFYARQFVTETIKSSNPQFEHEFRFSAAVTPDLMHYLRAESMTVLIFDDSQSDDVDAFVGSVRVPLLELVSGNLARQAYVIMNGSVDRGTITLSVVWETSFVNRLPIAVKLGELEGQVAMQTPPPELVKADSRASLLLEVAPPTNTAAAAPNLFSPDILPQDHFTIIVDRLTLTPDANLVELLAPVRYIFVAFTLLNYPPEDLETTSVSIWEDDDSRQTLRHQIDFGFVAGFAVDEKHHMPDRLALQAYVTQTDAFTVFSVLADPADESRECEVLAEGKLWWREWLAGDRADTAINIYHAATKAKLGQLHVHVRGWEWMHVG
ncbi:hypothetical protein RI367_004981 [Sorochytrium milnesiophthora]